MDRMLAWAEKSIGAVGRWRRDVEPHEASGRDRECISLAMS